MCRTLSNPKCFDQYPTQSVGQSTVPSCIFVFRCCSILFFPALTVNVFGQLLLSGCVVSLLYQLSVQGRELGVFQLNPGPLLEGGEHLAVVLLPEVLQTQTDGLAFSELGKGGKKGRAKKITENQMTIIILALKCTRTHL